MSDKKADRLVSELMATADSPGEAKAIAYLADAGLFEDAKFRRSVVPPTHKRVAWRRVIEFRHSLPDDDPRVERLERAADDARLRVPPAPEPLADLQVAIELDQTRGRYLAAWRDKYAADARSPNPYHHHIDLCLDELRRRGECWNCGRPAETTINELLVCAGCKESS